MKIAIISDTHDQSDRIQKVLAKIQMENCQAIIHCGDWCSPFSVKDVLSSALPVYGVLGNNDGDHFVISQLSRDNSKSFTLKKDILEIELDNEQNSSSSKKIAVNHYPEIALMLANSKKYDLVCYGHDHIKNLETIDSTLLLNPGALIKTTDSVYTFALYDTTSNHIDFIEVE